MQDYRQVAPHVVAIADNSFGFFRTVVTRPWNFEFGR